MSRLALKLLVAAVVACVMLLLMEAFVRAAVPVRNVGPAFTRYDPFYGKRLRPNLDVERFTPEVTFGLRTNSFAMRDPEPKQPPKRGVAFIGDSFTLGYGVEDAEAFPDLIRRELGRRGLGVPVLNCGMGNTGNGYWLKLLERDLPRLSPRVVVLQVMFNDFADNPADQLYRLDAAGELVPLSIPKPGAGRRLQSAVDAVPGLAYSHLLGLAWQAFQGQGLAIAPAQDVVPTEWPTDPLTYALIEQSVDRALALGARVFVMLVEIEGARRDKILALLQQRGVGHYDAPTKRERPELYYRIDGHWNPAGHRAVAAALVPRVLELLE